MEDKNLEIMRHSCAHVLAQAIKNLYPKAKLGIGPAIKDGFYYDIDLNEKISPEDLDKIESEMRKIISKSYKFVKEVLPKEEALKLMKNIGETYKVELVSDLSETEEISIYKNGEFIDLCRGPHLENTSLIKAFKLTTLAGAYWKGNEKNKMLQRIYGVAFESQEKMDEHLSRLEEAKKRDHRKLGAELCLFNFSEYGAGFPFFLPKGTILRNELENYWKELHAKKEYVEIKTPIILNKELWETSGHWYHYKENMYTTVIDDREYAIKPMNCPGSILIYKFNIHSYKEFPIRMGELGLVHRHEHSGNLHGLMRVRCFTQDDAHIYLLESQIKSEIINVINLIDEVYGVFGFKYHVELSTRPENSMGTQKQWEHATNSLKEALDHKGLNYIINEGDGAFYGPKIDFHLEDCIGRTWQCGTIQLDFQLPQKFDLNYVGEDNNTHRPIMIHRVVLGSVERFIGILTEHYAANFPTWISPVQVKILPISQVHYDYAKRIGNKLKDSKIRVETDFSNEKLSYKMRKTILEKVPYAIIIGGNEVENNLITIKNIRNNNQYLDNIDDFIVKIKNEIDNKEINPAL